MDMKFEDVRRVIDLSGIGSLQFHGEEEESLCESFGLPWFKTIKMMKVLTFWKKLVDIINHRLFCLTQVIELAGGTGKTFDWRLIPNQ